MRDLERWLVVEVVVNTMILKTTMVRMQVLTSADCSRNSKRNIGCNS